MFVFLFFWTEQEEVAARYYFLLIDLTWNIEDPVIFIDELPEQAGLLHVPHNANGIPSRAKRAHTHEWTNKVKANTNHFNCHVCSCSSNNEPIHPFTFPSPKINTVSLHGNLFKPCLSKTSGGRDEEKAAAWFPCTSPWMTLWSKKAEFTSSSNHRAGNKNRKGVNSLGRKMPVCRR